MAISKQELTSRFGNVNFQQLDEKRDSLSTDNFVDFEDLFDYLDYTRDYRALNIVHKFMHNLCETDLLMFFDELHKFELKVFEQRGISYSPILTAFNKYKYMLKNDYVNFIIKYFNEAKNDMEDLELTTAQQEFLSYRNPIIIEVLLNVGSKLNPNTYECIG